MERSNELLLKELKEHLKYVRTVLGPYEIAQAMRIPVRRLAEADALVNELGERLTNDPANAEIRAQLMKLSAQLTSVLEQLQDKNVLLEQKNDKIRALEEELEQMKKKLG